MAGQEAPHFNVYLTHLANAQMFRDKITTTDPAFAHLYAEAAAGAERQAAELAADPLVRKDALARAEHELQTLQELEDTRPYVPAEIFDATTKPLFERLQPMLDFILTHEITGERAEAIKRNAVAVGAIALESIVGVEPIADEAPVTLVAEPTTERVADPADQPTEAVVKPAEIPAQTTASDAPDADRVKTTDDQPAESAGLTTAELRPMLLARLADIPEGTEFDPQAISAEMLGDRRSHKTASRTKRIYAMLVISGVLEHNGRRGPASRYVLKNKAALPGPDQQPQVATPAEIRMNAESFDADSVLSVRDAQLFASILRRFSDEITELGLPCPAPEVLDTLLEATPMQTQATNAASLKKERRDALQKIEAFLADRDDIISKFSENLSELDARVRLVDYLQELRAVSNENIPNLLNLLKKEWNVIVVTKRHVVIGTTEAAAAPDTLDIVRRVAEEEAAPQSTVAAPDNNTQSKPSPEVRDEQIDPRLATLCKEAVTQMIQRFVSAKLDLGQTFMPSTKLSKQLRVRYLSDKLQVAASNGLIREDHLYADRYRHATAAEVIMAELYSKSHIRRLIHGAPNFVGDLIVQELQRGQQAQESSRRARRTARQPR